MVGDQCLLSTNGHKLWGRRGSPMGLTPSRRCGTTRQRIYVAQCRRLWPGTAHESPHAESHALHGRRRTVGIFPSGPVTYSGKRCPPQWGGRLRDTHGCTLPGRRGGERHPHSPEPHATPRRVIVGNARVLWCWGSSAGACSLFLAGRRMCDVHQYYGRSRRPPPHGVVTTQRGKRATWQSYGSLGGGVWHSPGGTS